MKTQPQSYPEIENQGQWAMVELVGYQIFTGQVSDKAIHGKQTVCLQVPETRVHKPYDLYFEIESIFRIIPITEQEAKRLLTQRERGRFAKNYDRFRPDVIEKRGSRLRQLSVSED